MNRKEALSVIRERSNARKIVRRCEKALWSGGDGSFAQRQDKLNKAYNDFNTASDKFPEAMAAILGKSNAS